MKVPTSDRRAFLTFLLIILALAALAVGLMIALAPPGHGDPTCGPGNLYDPTHQVCAPYMPSNPQPGYPQTCSGGYYDPLHGVCAPYPPAYPPPNYPWG